MIDLARVDVRLYDMITPIVSELTTHTGLAPDSILLVGAGCRDILHAAYGHDFPVRATTDVDIGIAVNDWSVSARIDKRYARLGANGIRYRIAGLVADIMPFSGIEDPSGISTPVARGAELVVFGFQDVYDRAVPLALPGGLTIRLPQPAGYAALKMRACIDRSAFHGHDKDARDLALATFWYQHSQETKHRLYNTDAGFDLLSSLDFDPDIAAAKLLGFDIAAQLSPDNRQDLAQRWAAQDLDEVAKHFLLPAGAPHLSDTIQRRTVLEYLAP